ncbi:MAG: 6-bladed beta-propeller [Candidatus Aminicenantes bacterium]|nr:6-bladed beta-propeller [Candidatus Aminicenantes bacterium]
MKKAFLIYLIIPFLLVKCNQQKSEWKGSIEKINSVVVVKNPKEPIYGEDAVTFEEELVIKEDEEKYLFSNLIALAVTDDETLFALDYKAMDIKKFDKNGIFVKIFGKKGQGPGEFIRPFSLSVTGENEIIIYDLVSRRFSFYSKDGQFIKDLSAAEFSFTSPRVDSKGNILAIIAERNRENPVYDLKKYDSALNYVCSYISIPIPDPLIYNIYRPSLQWTLNEEDKVIFGYPEKYEFHIFNPEGSEIMKIEKEFTPNDITQEHIDLAKKAAERFSGEMKLEIPPHYPAYSYISVEEKDNVFVQTYYKENNVLESFYDVFNPDGKFICKIQFDAMPRAWKKGKLYTIENDEEGFQVIKIYRVTWNY